MRSGGLCLVKGHISKECPKVNFKCQKLGCGCNHYTVMHRPTDGIERNLNSGSNQRNNASQNSNISATSAITEQDLQLSQVTAGSHDVTGAGSGNGSAVEATGAGETGACLWNYPC